MKNEKPALSAQVVVKEETTAVLSEQALSFYYDKDEKMHKVVTIKYNPQTKQAKIDTVVNAGEYRAMAINNFKMACVKLGLI